MFIRGATLAVMVLTTLSCSQQAALARIITAKGTVNPTAIITVGSTISGSILSVDCATNATVTKGQVCAQIDPRPFERALDVARAALATARAQLTKDTATLNNAKATYDRNTILAAHGVVAKAEFANIEMAYEQEQAQFEVDKATIEQREAQVAAAELNLNYTKITSPIDGVVLDRRIAVGETVAASFEVPTLFMIASDLSHLHVVLQIGETDIGTIKAGDHAMLALTAYPSRRFKGSVARIGNNPRVLDGIPAYEVDVDVDNADLSLKPGMSASVDIETGG